jgi:4,5-dihydroxyphthalate decarboxylase
LTRKIPLTVMLGDYDITRAVFDGTAEPQGVDLTVLTAPSPQRHWRMLKHGEFDAAELSLGSYVTRRARGMDDLVAIPVFPHRRFRHGYVFVSGKADVTTAADLAGTSVGLRSWQVTAGVWLRGILAEHHGLALDEVRWVTQDDEDEPLDLPPRLRVDRVPAGATVTGMCADGELAGLIYPEIPGQVERDEGTIRRLFPDPKQAEQDYFRTTGIFPIMHVVAIKAEVLDRHPWVARNLMETLEQAKQLAYRRMRDPRTVSLAWLRALQEEERALLGPDPWEYGLSAANRANIETFLAYAADQGMGTGGLTADDLFHPGTREIPPSFV